MAYAIHVGVFLCLCACLSEAAFSDSGVPCYLHPSGDKCHYRMKLDSPTCTSAERKKRLTEGVQQLNRTLTVLEAKLIRLGIIPPDNACSELPSVENGGVVYSDLNLAPHCVGRYVCNEGYIIHSLYGRKEFTCTEDGVWDGEVLQVPVQCVLEVNQCDHPEEVANGNITYQDNDPANILPGDMIEYICAQGTELQGPQYRFCQRNGNWSDFEPECIVVNAKKAVEPANLGEILGGIFGSLSAVTVIIVAIVVALLLLRYRKRKDGHQRMSSGLEVYNDDPSMNTGVNDSRRYLLDSKSAVADSVKTPKPSSKDKVNKTVHSRQELEESMM